MELTVRRARRWHRASAEACRHVATGGDRCRRRECPDVPSDEHITWSCGWHGPLEDYTVLPLPTRGFPLPCESECNSTSSAPEKDVTSVCYSGHKFGMTRIRAPVHSNSSVCFPVESRFRMVQGEPPNPKPRIQTSVLQIAPDLNKKSRTPNCKPSVGARKTLAT